MNHRVSSASRASALALAILLAPGLQSAAAQGLKPPAKPGGQGLSRPAAPAASDPLSPLSPLPAAPSPSAPEGAARSADFIVAVVNSEPVTNNELRSRLMRAEAQIARQGGQPPERALLARELLERIILERVQIQQARESGIQVDEWALAQSEQALARQNGLPLEQFHERLAREGLGRERFRQELRNQLLMQRLRERELESRVKVSDIDVEQYLREEAGDGDPAAMEINLGHVLVLVPENATPAQLAEREARAQQAAARLRAGADFAAVAREFSDAPEGARAGGTLGLRPVDRYPELFVESTRGLPLGSVVGPLRSPAGFHLLKVLERVNAGLPASVLQSHARHILLRTGAQLSESAAAARLAEYRRRVLAGADFAALARAHSQDGGSAKQGGDLGWANPGRYAPEFEQALDALAPGEISEPLASRFGVHLIELLERREVKLSAREQREMARANLREKKRDEAYAAWTQELRARAYVEYREPPQPAADK